MVEMTYFNRLNALYELLQYDAVSPNAQLLYHTLLMIFNRAGWRDEIKRTNSQVCELCRLSDKAISNAKNELKQLGLIDFKIIKRKYTIYSLPAIITANMTVKTEVKTEGKAAVKRELKGRLKGSYNGGSYKDKDKDEDNNPPKSPQGEFATVIENYTGDEELQKALYDYIAMRKNIKKPITVRGLELALKKLDTLATSDADKTAVVNQSVMSSWLGLFPLRDNTQTSSVFRDSTDYAYSDLERRMIEKYDGV